MAIQEDSLVCGRNGYRYRLEKEIGAGGEGRVYRIAGENLVAKIYKKAEPEVEKKIRFLVQNPIADLHAGGKRILALAWPQDILCDDQGNFIGYTMPFIRNGVEICTVARGCDMPKAKAMFPDYDWLFGLQVAINLSKAVEYLHAHACIIGDLSPRMGASPCWITTASMSGTLPPALTIAAVPVPRIILPRSSRDGICAQAVPILPPRATILPWPSIFFSC